MPPRKAPLRRTGFGTRGDGLKRSNGLKRGKGFAASTAQKIKVRDLPSVVSGQEGCDPAHLWPRGRGGCDDPLCVVPLTRAEHDAFDDGVLDLLPYLIDRGYVPEMQHALGHCESPKLLIERLTGKPWAEQGAA